MSHSTAPMISRMSPIVQRIETLATSPMRSRIRPRTITLPPSRAAAGVARREPNACLRLMRSPAKPLQPRMAARWISRAGGGAIATRPGRPGGPGSGPSARWRQGGAGGSRRWWARWDRARVLRAGQVRGRRGAAVTQDLELDFVDVEVVERPRAVADLPHLGGAHGDDLVDAVHVHRLAVDRVRAGDLDAAGPGGAAGVERRVPRQAGGDRGRAAQLAGGPHLQQVEGVVAAVEARCEAVLAQVRLEAAEQGALAWPEGGGDQVERSEE